VLLRNRDNLLPLDAAAVRTIAVIGPFAGFAQTGPNYTGLWKSRPRRSGSGRRGLERLLKNAARRQKAEGRRQKAEDLNEEVR